MAIQRPEKSGQRPQPPTHITASPLAEQSLSSEKELLTAHLSKYQILRYPILGAFIKFLFGNSLAKRHYIKGIKQKFIDNATGKTCPPEAAEMIADKLTPLLKTKSMEELQHVERFIDKGGSMLFFDRKRLSANLDRVIILSSTHPQEVDKGFLEYFRLSDAVDNMLPADKSLIIGFLMRPYCRAYAAELLDTGQAAVGEMIGIMKKNTARIDLALSTAETVFTMMGNRFSSADRLRYFKEWVRLAKQKKPDKFDETLSFFRAYLELAQKVQKERPAVYLASELPPELGKYQEHLMTGFEQSPFLRDVSFEILQGCAFFNTQFIEENIRALFAPPEQTGTVYALNKLRDSPLSLSREFIPDLTLYEDSDQEIDFQASTNLYLTNEKTMETRCLRVLLPITGKMSKTEARARLEVLRKTVRTPNDFDSAYDSKSLPPDQKEVVRVKYAEWVEQIEREFAKISADFNGSIERPAFSFAREVPSVAAALLMPDSLERAIEASKTQNIFLLDDGSLSLLPQECAHPKIGQFSSEEIENAIRQLIQKSSTEIVLPIMTEEKRAAFEKGTMRFDYDEEIINTKPYLRLKTTIAQDGKEKTRVTLYRLKEGQKPRQKFEEMTETGQLIRDFLLAKAGFMNEYV